MKNIFIIIILLIFFNLFIFSNILHFEKSRNLKKFLLKSKSSNQIRIFQIKIKIPKIPLH